MNNISDLLPIIACPACHGDLIEQGEQLQCTNCNSYFDIKNGIPHLLIKCQD